MIIAFLTAVIATATTYVAPGTNPLPVADSRGLPINLFGGDEIRSLVKQCVATTAVEVDGDAVHGCLYSDVGTVAASNPVDSRFTMEVVLVEASDPDNGFGKDLIRSYAVYKSGVDGAGKTLTHTSFPGAVDFVKQLQPITNPTHKHTTRVTITQADQTMPRVVQDITTSYTWTQLNSTGIAVSIPSGAAWPNGSMASVYVNIPDGTYTGNSASSHGSHAATSTGGGTQKPGIHCAVASDSDDYAVVTLLKGTVASGVGYCKFNNGSNRYLKITIN